VYLCMCVCDVVKSELIIGLAQWPRFKLMGDLNQPVADWLTYQQDPNHMACSAIYVTVKSENHKIQTAATNWTGRPRGSQGKTLREQER